MITIFSQKRLVQNDGINIRYQHYSVSKFEHQIISDDYFLGGYESEERCLEILLAIWKARKNPIQDVGAIFEMPEK